MIDLRFSYTTKNSGNVTEEFDTIMAFTDAIESGDISKDILNGTNVEAIFFENPLSKKHFDTVQELYEHCISIMS